MPVVIAIIDLHLDAFIDGVAFALRLNRDADEDSGVALLVRHLIDDLDGRVADFLLGVPKHPLAGRGFEQTVVHGETLLVRREKRPALQILAVEKLPGLGAERRGHQHRSDQKRFESHRL